MGVRFLCGVAKICPVSQCKQVKGNQYFTVWLLDGLAFTRWSFTIFLCLSFLQCTYPIFHLCLVFPLNPHPSSLHQSDSRPLRPYLVPTFLPFRLSALPVFCLTEASVLQKLARRWLRRALRVRLRFPREQLAVRSYLSASIFSPLGGKLDSFREDIKTTPFRSCSCSRVLEGDFAHPKISGKHVLLTLPSLDTFFYCTVDILI